MWGKTVVQSLTRFKTTTIHDWKQCRENPNMLLHNQQSLSRGITGDRGKEKQSWHSWESHANRAIDKERVTKSSCGIGPWPGRMNWVIPVQSASGRCELEQEVKLRSASSSHALVEETLAFFLVPCYARSSEFLFILIAYLTEQRASSDTVPH